ncbi:MAG: sulfatase-like hydrolase/transferase [Alphaproteobacteria bacterium]|nr:sulfatase-like hydrolase/transferase [Alphaproteobacteria bacterium]
MSLRCTGLFLALTVALLAPPGAAEPSRKPNVLVILADDLGLGDITAYGGRVPTPNIDRIGHEGVIFDAGYVTAPICSPSRAGLLTGRYQQRFGFEHNARPDPKLPEIGLPLTERTIGDAMRAAGYRTLMVGKWHQGATAELYPTNRGFDKFFGVLSFGSTYIDIARPDVVSLTEDDFREVLGTGPETQVWSPGPETRGPYLVYEGPERTVVHNEDKYLTEEFAAKAVSYIEESAGEPFFMYLAFTAPHSPFQATRKYYDRFPDAASKVERVYFAMVSALDDAVGRVLDTLDATGISGDTLVIFLSDNGCAAYHPGICSCEPVRGGKLTQFEGGIRVPFLLRWPGRVAAGQHFPEPVSSLDILPTALGVAGAAPDPGVPHDGANLLPYLDGTPADRVHELLVWRNAPAAAARLGDLKLVKPDMDAEGGYLFDLAGDPRETRDLYAERPADVARLEAALAAWRKDKIDPAWPARRPVVYPVCGLPEVPFPF